ncbi:uncharacterized protein PFL1_04320 [Pseudozyma flocculosa PF-1]|uniref:thioredoxin-dependent peroxiredoxin n=2 Tax=Pseudozyma flocculosa TaxID=84751 RepID=A0A5C3FDA6_9BASI|nr:uncharacterized protein PFL1_04320 [Pseudozyma flocculosa PF-1]EPQ27993.1 hypothetical protein PFL1_04320 [Pseudozyma flocculosa PF-1]SPO41617.1 related to DOT5 - nuclear thiol peroxidase [Pseudozyma flocculosa]
MAEPRRSSRVASRGNAASNGTAASTIASTKAAAPAAAAAAPKAKAKRPAASADADDKTSAAADETASKKSKPTPAAAASASSGVLTVGSPLPSLSLITTSDAKVDPSTFRKTVIFTYPRANTSGCTTQAKAYRDAYDKYTDAGYAVYGLSNDGVTPLKNWKDKLGIKFELISDPKRDLVGALTGSKDKTRRSHFVIDEDGKLALSKLSVKPPESSSDALAFIQKSNK